jgi:hypothetical protein
MTWGRRTGSTVPLLIVLAGCTSQLGGLATGELDSLAEVVAAIRAEAAAGDVLEAAEVALLHVLDMDGDRIEAWMQELKALSTDTYAREAGILIDATTRSALAAAQTRADGRIVDSYVQEVDGDRAEVFIVAEQTVRSTELPRPRTDELRAEIVLRYVDDRWLLEEVAILGPSVANRGS